ncbi:MAG: glucokinase [Methyloceanibacter sp.]
MRLSSASEGAAQLRRHRRGGTSYKRCDQLTNSTWSFTIEELRRVTGLDDILVFNDFQALAWSLPHLRREELHRIGESESLPHATKVVLGPGTGIGVAGLVWSGTSGLRYRAKAGTFRLPLIRSASSSSSSACVVTAITSPPIACSPGLVLPLFIRPLRSLKVGALSRFRQMRC